MAVITSNVTALDVALKQQTLTVLILTGGQGSVAQQIHDLAEAELTQPWRRIFILRDRTVLSALTALTAAQRQALKLNDDERYATWNCTSMAAGPTGSTADLLRSDGQPSILRIRHVFAQGDIA